MPTKTTAKTTRAAKAKSKTAKAAPVPARKVKEALAAMRKSSPRAFEDVLDYAALLGQELDRLQGEPGAPATTRELFEGSLEYDCPDTAFIMGSMLGYVRAGAQVAGVEPWHIVDVVTGRA